MKQGRKGEARGCVKRGWVGRPKRKQTIRRNQHVGSQRNALKYRQRSLPKRRGLNLDQMVGGKSLVADVEPYKASSQKKNDSETNRTNRRRVDLTRPAIGPEKTNVDAKPGQKVSTRTETKKNKTGQVQRRGVWGIKGKETKDLGESERSQGNKSWGRIMIDIKGKNERGFSTGWEAEKTPADAKPT